MKKFILSLFLLCLLVIALLLPQILSTSLGKGALTRLLSSDEQSVKISTLRLSWTGPQVIDGLVFESKPHALSGEIQQITIHSELWNLFLHKKNLKKTDILAPYIHLKRLPLAQTAALSSPLPPLNFASTTPKLPPLLKKIKKSSPFCFKGTLNIDKGAIDVAMNSEKVQFLDIKATLVIPYNSLPHAITLTCQTLQQSTYGQAQLKAALNDQGQVVVLASAKQLPIQGVDDLLALKFPHLRGVLYKALGDHLDLKLDALLSASTFNLSLSASSPNFLADIQTKKEGDIITFASPAALSLTLSPELATILLSLTDLPPFTLQKTSQLLLKIPTFTLPLNNATPDFSKAALTSTLTLTPTTLSLPSLEKTIDLKAFSATIASPNLSETLNTHLSFTLAHLGKESTGEVQAIFHGLENGTAAATLNHFPTALFDQSHLTALWLGPTLNLNIQNRWEAKTHHLTLSATTSHLTLPTAHLTLKEELTLDSPLTLTYSPPKPLLDYLSAKTSLPITELTSATLTLDELSLQSPREIHSLALRGNVTTDNLTLGPFDFPTLKLKLRTKTLSDIHCEIESPTLDTELFLSLNPKHNTLEFKKSPHIKYLITPELINTLETPALCDITLSLNATLKGEGTIAPLIFKGPAKASLEETAFKFAYDPAGDRLTLNLRQEATLNKETSGTIDLALALKHPFDDTKRAIQSGKGSIKHLRSQALDSLLPFKAPVSKALGESLDFTFSAEEKGSVSHIHTTLRSDRLKGNLSLVVKDGGDLTSTSPATLEWTLTPDALSLLQELSGITKEPPFSLAAPAKLSLTLSELQWPDHFDHAALKGDFALDSLTFETQERTHPLTMSHLKGTFSKKPESPLSITLKGKSPPSGDLSFTGTLNNLVDARGNLTLAHITADLSADVRQIPSPFVDLVSTALLRTDLHLTTLLGPTLDARLNTHLESCCGDLTLSLSGERAGVSFNGHLQKGILTLNSPLHAQLQVDEATSKLLLEKANPFGISSFVSEAPITLEISEKEFRLPLFPFKPYEMDIGSGHLELGKLHCANKGNLKSILKLLKKGQMQEDKTLELWFTTLNMKVKQGVLDLQRTEIFIDNLLELALWGRVDFPKDRVDMVVGLTEHTLKEAFNIKSLPSDYVMHIPLKGTTTHVNYDKVKATTKIASLLAWDHTSKGKSKESIWDDFLEAVGTLPDKDAKTPPAQKPLPWDPKKKLDKKPNKKKQKEEVKPAAVVQPPEDPRIKNRNPFKEMFKALR